MLIILCCCAWSFWARKLGSLERSMGGDQQEKQQVFFTTFFFEPCGSWLGCYGLGCYGVRLETVNIALQTTGVAPVTWDLETKGLQRHGRGRTKRASFEIRNPLTYETITLHLSVLSMLNDVSECHICLFHPIRAPESSYVRINSA
jgi:hypothetical protein